MKKPLSFISVIVGIVVLLTVLQVVVSNKLSTTGVVLGRYQDEIRKYETENTILAQKLLISTSLASIASQAASLGFIEGNNKLILSAPIPLARER
ncbi:MAG: hypothetical protein AAB907_02680 [Patescibacteria group bacterium]